MGMTSFSVNVGMVLDTDQVTQQVDKFYSEVKKRPLVIDTQFSKVSTNSGDAQKVLDSIKAQAKSIDEVIVKQKTWDAGTRGMVTAVTEMKVVWRDALGNIFTNIEKVDNGLGRIPRRWKELREETAKLDVGGPSKEVNALFDKNLKAFAAMEKKANDWSIRAENMSEKEKRGILETSEKLKEKIKLYDQLAKSNDPSGAAAMEAEIRKLNKTLDDNISATKRAATGVRGWVDSINNAIKQTISYAITTGTLVAAQNILNRGMEYTIELNKEMLKIQVLQAQGAQTDAEIKSLATAYNGLARELGATTLEIAKGSTEWLRQGKSIDETAELLRSSTMLSKLGALEAADATEYLTSTINSYGMAASQAVDVVDKLVNKHAKTCGDTWGIIPL